MDDSLKEAMMLYGVTLGRRFTRRQKRVFQNVVSDMLNQRHIPYSFQEAGASFWRARNIVIGDLSKAEFVLFARYDTPALALCPGYRVYPFQPHLQKKMKRRKILFESMFAFLFYALFILFAKMIFEQGIFFGIVGAIAAIVFFFLGTVVSSGIACPVNFNGNSAAVALIMDMVIKHRAQKRAAFILADGRAGFAGYRALLKEKRVAKRTVLILQSIAYGKEQLLLQAESRAEFFPLPGFLPHALSDRQAFEHFGEIALDVCMIASGTRCGNDFVFPHIGTRQDCAIDMERLAKLEEDIAEIVLKRRGT